MTDKKEHDIFDVLKRIEKGDRAFFDGLEEYETRKLSPLVLMKWMSGTKSADQIKLINGLINPMVFSLYKHPYLSYKLLMASNANKGNRLVWMKKKGKPKDSETIRVIKEHTGCSSSVAVDYLYILSNDDIIEMAEDIGTDKETMTKLKKELDGKEPSL